MYRRILLAYDGTVEGRTALREGALLAHQCGAQVFLLAVLASAANVQVADSLHSGVLAQHHDDYKRILEEGAEKLRQIGLDPVVKLAIGDPMQEIRAFAQSVEAEVIVVSHRKRSLLERWWSGSTGAYLIDNIGCTLLIARNVITDEAFYAQVRKKDEKTS